MLTDEMRYKLMRVLEANPRDQSEGVRTIARRQRQAEGASVSLGAYLTSILREL